jgi:hypothetical protein
MIPDLVTLAIIICLILGTFLILTSWDNYQ